jgi:hypothetical protein
MRATAWLLGVAMLTGCSTRAVPEQRTYVDRHQMVFDLVTLAIESLDGHVILANRQADTITGEFPADIAGLAIFIEVRLERHQDETVVRAKVHGGHEQLELDVLEAMRQKFFERLDDLAADRLPGAWNVPPPRGPVDAPTPGPWPLGTPRPF